MPNLMNNIGAMVFDDPSKIDFDTIEAIDISAIVSNHWRTNKSLFSVMEDDPASGIGIVSAAMEDNLSVDIYLRLKEIQLQKLIGETDNAV